MGGVADEWLRLDLEWSRKTLELAKFRRYVRPLNTGGRRWIKHYPPERQEYVLE
jgi:hypothetical protein